MLDRMNKKSSIFNKNFEFKSFCKIFETCNKTLMLSCHKIKVQTNFFYYNIYNFFYLKLVINEARVDPGLD